MVQTITEKDVIEFVAKMCGYSIEKITLGTRLKKDIGLDGDDADEFMSAYFQMFGVDSVNYNFDNYFNVEAGFNPLTIFSWFKRDTKPDITIKNLAENADSKKWCRKN